MIIGDALGRSMVELLETDIDTPPTPSEDYSAWAGQFSGADLADPSADHDGDGMTNGEEHIFGLNPTRGDSINPIALPLHASSGTLTYTRRRTALTGASFRYEWSATLEAGSWTPFTPASKASDGGDPVETVTVTLDGTLLEASKLFVRIVGTVE